MRLLAVAVAVLALSACGSRTTPAASSPAASSAGANSSTPAVAATLDCAKPDNAAQQLICDDPVLTDLNHRLQGAYQQALGRPGADQAGLTAAQNRWASVRDGCAPNTDLRTCAVEAYQTRLVQLAMADPATVVPPLVSYQCPAEFGPLTGQFYNQLVPPTVVLDWKGYDEILFAEPSGSGVRYGRQGSQYWEHQGQVELEFSGTKFACHTR